MVRVVLLTNSRAGTASACLPLLAKHAGVDLAMVVLARAGAGPMGGRLLRKVRKLRRVGVGGAVAGYLMRSWYRGPPTADLQDLAERFDIPFRESPGTNAKETTLLFREAGADLGLSLGNELIHPRVYETPRFGMLNVHAEVLPRFRGAASVVWAIHGGIPETGFTIHEVARGLDTGRILYQERIPIEFMDGLAETVRHNVAVLSRLIPPAVARVVGGYTEFAERAIEQGDGRAYTTPTLREFLHMRRQFRTMRSAARDHAGVAKRP